MASTPVKFQADGGQTLTCYIVADGGTGTPAASYSATGVGGGWYYVTVTEALVGKFLFSANDPTPANAMCGLVNLADTTAVHYVYDPCESTGLLPSAGGSGGASAADIWDYLTSAISTSGSIGKLIKDYLDAAITSRLASSTTGTGLSAIPWNSAWDAEVQSEVDDALAALGYTSTRAAKLDNLDATVTSRQSEANASSRHSAQLAEHDDTQADIAAIDVTSQVEAGLTAQGYTTTRAPKLDNLDATVASRQSESDASDRYDALTAEHDATQSAIAALASPSTIAAAVYDYATADANTADSMGLLFTTMLDAAISSRQAETDADTRYNALIAEHDATQSAIASITTSVSPTDIDSIADAVWQYLTSDATTSGSLGKLIVDTLDAAISSRESEASASSRASADATGHSDTQSAISALSDISTTDVESVITGLGYTGTRATKLDNLDATISSLESESSAGSRQTALLAQHTATQDAIAALDIEAGATSALAAQGYTTTRATKLDNLDNLTAVPPTAAAIADTVLDEALSGHQTAGTTGEAIQIARDQAVVAANNTQV